MIELVLYCKSYRRDFLRLKRLLVSIQKYNVDQIPFYISTPQDQYEELKNVLGSDIEYHWVSDESINDIAGVLGMTSAEVDSRATFYTRIYRRPVGKNVILICESASCLSMGFENIYDHISKRLRISFGETTGDNLFTLLPVTCLGNCDHAPSIMINEETFNDLTIGKIDELLDKYSGK